MLCQMLKYFGPPTRVPKFSTHVPLSKFALQQKLIQSVVRVSCLSQVARNLYVTSSILKVLGLRIESPKSQTPNV